MCVERVSFVDSIQDLLLVCGRLRKVVMVCQRREDVARLPVTYPAELCRVGIQLGSDLVDCRL
jgi:hypothetical protein